MEGNKVIVTPIYRAVMPLKQDGQSKGISSQAKSFASKLVGQNILSKSNKNFKGVSYCVEILNLLIVV